MRRTIFIAFSIVALGTFGYSLFYFHAPLALVPIVLKEAASAAYSGSAVSVADLHTDYDSTVATKHARILLVPGHEPDSGGAEFKSAKEHDMVADIAQSLQGYLDAEGNYTAFTTRSRHAWDSTFSNYFAQDWSAIVAWDASARASAETLGLDPTPLVDHLSAPTNVALRLYGITKWADENSIDITIHMHFNDHDRPNLNVAGPYSGFVIYVPAQQYDNSTTSHAVAESMLRRLTLYNPVSNLYGEHAGIVEDPELIAVGANNTAGAASMLIEYDYIYQPQFANAAVRPLALKDLAYQTYLGLQDFFTRHAPSDAIDEYDPSTLYAWDTPVVGKSADPKDIYALQTALMMDGDYPPEGKSMNDCPHSGTFGQCTLMALAAFQHKNGISKEGVDGPKTFALLHNIYWKQ